MLGDARIGAFVPTTDGERARTFYVDVLGLKFVSDDQFALVLDANGVNVRVSKVGGFTPQKFTILGWEVGNIEKVVVELTERGVSFENYGLPGQDEHGIWTAPVVDNATGGAKVAWFKDPDGNVLSVSQFQS
jgi:catechol 2,3-dioxygenase-like lactoylglutathione lyase family enzyme